VVRTRILGAVLTIHADVFDYLPVNAYAGPVVGAFPARVLK